MKLATLLAWTCLMPGLGAVPAGVVQGVPRAGRSVPARTEASTPGCRKLMLTGEVASGKEGAATEWSAPIGEGWVFRVVPIANGKAGESQAYSGWDLVVDRENGGGYPDALLLATPPYFSPSEREIGTTYGLRAQDAIGWSPRHVHFLTSVTDLERARQLFRQLTGPGAASLSAAQRELISKGLLGQIKSASAGEFRVLDARFSAGTADPPAYAQQWVPRLHQIPHTVVDAGGPPSARGELRSLRFALTLWLPARWSAPPGHALQATNCAQ